MKKIFKRSLAVVLAVVVTFGSAPLAGLAGLELPEFNLFGIKAEAATSGYFTYSVSNNQATITDVSTSISGSVTIPATLGGYPVTSIGSGAFENCTGLTNVTIPDSVTSIGYDAFSSCTGLASITIPDSVTSIGNYAFFYCTKLTSITIPDSVTSISSCAFSNCTGLTSVTIGNSVTSIGSYAFSGCDGLTSVTIPDSVTSIGSRVFSYCTGLTSVTIPDSVTSIDNYVFYYCTGLTSVTIPDSVTSIGSGAFEYCTGLTSITIPNSVTSIGDYAFSHCTGLTSITIPDSVTSIGSGAFEDCTGLTSITVDENNPNFSSDESGVVFNKNKTMLIQYPIGNERTEYIIPDSVTSIGSGAFENCTGLTSVIIPDSVTSIGNDAFRECTGLTSVTIGNSVTSIGSYAFFGCDGLTSVTIPDSVTSIGGGAFEYCTGLTSVTIPDSVTSIGSQSFFGCDGLINVTIGKGLICIPDCAFVGCYSLNTLIIGENVTNIGSDAFGGCSGLETVDLGESLVSIEDGAFDRCTNIINLTIHENLMEIDNNVFGYSSPELQNLYYEGNFVNFFNLSVPSSTEYNLYVNGELVENVLNVPEGVSNMQCDLNDIKGINIVNISSTVESICWDFPKYKKIKYIINPKNPYYYTDEHGAIYNIEKTILYTLPYDSEVTDYVVPDSIELVCWGAFAYCKNLVSVKLPENASLNDGAYMLFWCCENLKTVNLPNTIWALAGTFAGCESLESIIIPESVQLIQDYAFKNCTSLKSVVLPDSVVEIYDYAFENCSSLESVVLSKNLESINGFAFLECKNLKTIEIPENVSIIEGGVFSGCSSLEEVRISSSSVESIENAFLGCNSLKRYVVDEKNQYYSSDKQGLLYNKDKTTLLSCPSGLTGKVVLPDTLTDISDYAFVGCKDIDLVIPDNFKIGGYDWLKYICASSFVASENNPIFLTENGVLYSKDKSVLVKYPVCSEETIFVVPETVTDIVYYETFFSYGLGEIMPYYLVYVLDDVEMICRPKNLTIHYSNDVDLESTTFQLPILGASVVCAENIDEEIVREGKELIESVKAEIQVEIDRSVELIEQDYQDMLSHYECNDYSEEYVNIISPSYLERYLEIADIYRQYIELYDLEFAVCNHSGSDHAHSYSFEVTKEASCTETGIITYTCECGDNYTEEIEKIGHSAGEWEVITESTCTTQGRKIKKCTVCETITQNETIPFAEHPDSNSDGLCDICDKISNVELVKDIYISIATPENRTINYMESVKLYATTANLPEGYKIKWKVEGEGVSIKPSTNGKSCTVTSTSTGNVVIKAYIVDSNGNIVTDENGKQISDSEYFYSEANLWLRIVYFFKKLFGIIISTVQVFKGII